MTKPIKCIYCETEPNNATRKKELKVCCCYMLHKIGNIYKQHYKNGDTLSFIVSDGNEKAN